MTQRGTDPAGNPVGLIGQPLLPGRGSVPGVVIVKGEDMAKPNKASADGHYTLNGARFRVRKGGVIPADAEYEPGAFFSTNEESRAVRRSKPAEEEEPEERAQQAAPENKAKQAAPETKAKGH